MMRIRCCSVAMLCLLTGLACVAGQIADEKGGVQAAQRTVQIPKPEIPTLVYYPLDKLWQSAFGNQGEIAFNDGSTDARLGDIPDNFQSRISCGSDALPPINPWITDERIAQQISPTTCRQLLSQTSIRLKTSSSEQTYLQRDFFPIPASQTWRGNAVNVPNPSKQGTQAKSLSPCCRQSECPNICLQNPEPQRCYLEIFTMSTGVIPEDSIRAELARIFTGQILTTIGGAFFRFRFRVPCDHCPLSNCITNCSNGEYATGFADTSTGLQVNRVECKPCPPGTWNTCTDQLTCKWSIPQGMDRAVGTSIHALPGGPVGSCYPCSYVTKCPACTLHYVGTTRETFIDTSLAWRCPGGDMPPKNCINKNFRMSPDGSECVCSAGLYPSGPDCVPCEAGYMCPNGTKVQCPIHYYQPATGATSCLQCGSTGDDNGFFRCDRRGYLLQFCDPARPGSQTKDLMRQCVQCNQCRRAYASNADPYLVGCYRDA